MKIKCYLCRSAPELCYFTLNGIRYQEQPMLGKQVDWYKAMYNPKALCPTAMVRAKHFSRSDTRKVATITVTYEDLYPPSISGGTFWKYAEVLEYVEDLREHITTPHTITIKTVTLTGSK
jgi:hypothetical protein